MAVEVFPDSPSSGMSPRISFSHDLTQNDAVPVEQYIRSSSSSSIDFDFCVFRNSFDQESSSADELFFDGKILPIEIKKRLPPPRRPEAVAVPPPPPPQVQKTSIDQTKGPNSETEEKQNNSNNNNKPSFWRFKRSTSLNDGGSGGYARTLCPLPLLSRSNSTGSASNVKRSSLSNNQKRNFMKFSSPNSSLKHSSSTGHQKPPLKRTSHGSYSNGVKINPVLNIPPANLFGLGFIFSGGKDRSKKK